MRQRRAVNDAGMGKFVAIDFETADHGRESACALGMAVVEGCEIVREEYVLIRPPHRQFLFTWVHGIRWEDVAGAPTFCEVWPTLLPMLEGAEFIAAHNAGFDRSVLYQCCHSSRMTWPSHRFQCSAKLARQSWGLPSVKLPEVCRHLGIDLRHHRADSDARACARIVIAAREQGLPLSPWLGAFGGRLIEARPTEFPGLAGR